jgi:hypothetical protein
MTREKIEKLSTLFLAVFCTGLAAQLATVGMAPLQWIGAALAVTGSIGLALAVRVWREAPAQARRASSTDRDAL